MPAAAQGFSKANIASAGADHAGEDITRVADESATCAAAVDHPFESSEEAAELDAHDVDAPLPAPLPGPSPSDVERHTGRAGAWVWLIAFIVVWVSRNRITATAADELLDALRSVWPWLLPADAQPVEWPTTLQQATEPVAVNRKDAFLVMAMCPNQRCGKLFSTAELALLVAEGRAAQPPRAARCDANLFNHREKSREAMRAWEAMRVQECEELTRERDAAILAAEEALREAKSNCRAAPTQSVLAFASASSSGAAAAAAPAADAHRASSRHAAVVERASASGAVLVAERALAAARAQRMASRYPLLRCDTALTKPGRRCAPIGDAASSGATATPILPYHLTSIATAIERILQEPGNDVSIEDWRRSYRRVADRTETVELIDPDLLGDVHHGARWAEHQWLHANGTRWDRTAHAALPASEQAADLRARLPLLAARGTLALALNTDNFQPFTNGTYSLGGIYLTIENLPREERHLTRNMILVGLLPGPKHSSREQTQSAFVPIMDQLLQLMRGVLMVTHSHPNGLLVRAYLHTVVCDMPAARMLCGFGLHSANFGCAFCNDCLETHAAANHKDYSLGSTGQRRSWTPRTDGLHRAQADRWAQCSAPVSYPPRRATRTSKSSVDEWDARVVAVALSKARIARDKCFRSGDRDGSRGSRWCAVMMLPYFDVVRGTVIDAMHAFFLGTVKRIMQLTSLETPRAVVNTDVDRDPPPTRKRRLDAYAPDEAATAADAEAEADAEADAAAAELDAADAIDALPDVVEAIDRRRSADIDVESEADTERESDSEAAIATSDEEDGEERKSGPARPAAGAAAPAASARRTASRSTSGRPIARAVHMFDPRVLQRRDVADETLRYKSVSMPALISKSAHLAFFQQFVDSSLCSADVGRIPRKIESSMTSFKADEWSTLATLFAVPAMREMMRVFSGEKNFHFEHRHLELWVILSEAATLIKRPVLTRADVGRLDRHLMRLLCGVEVLFTALGVTPNLHLHGHMKAMILDNGPPLAFACYAYERANGLLANVPMSYHQVELCIFRRHTAHFNTDARIRRVARAMRQPEYVAAHHGQAGPHAEDWEHISAMMVGVSAPMLAAPAPSAAPAARDRAAPQLEHRVTTTASKRTQHVYRWVGDSWQDDYRRFVAMRTTLRGVLSVHGHEEYPGRLSAEKEYPPGFITDARRKFLIPSITAEHLEACLRQVYERWTDAELAAAASLPAGHIAHAAAHAAGVGDRDAPMRSYDLSNAFQVYDRLDLAGDRIASAMSKRSVRSSYVLVALGNDTRVSVAQKVGTHYAQVQAFITHRQFGHVHHFAIVRYFNLRTYTSAEAKARAAPPGAADTAAMRRFYHAMELYPILLDEFEPLDPRYNLVPVHLIVALFVPAFTGGTARSANGRADQVQIIHAMPMGSALHASSAARADEDIDAPNRRSID